MNFCEINELGAIVFIVAVIHPGGNVHWVQDHSFGDGHQNI
jgi:hypothetical protein